MFKALKGLLLLIVLYVALQGNQTLIDDAAQSLAARVAPATIADPDVVVVLVDEALPDQNSTGFLLRCLTERILASGALAVAVDYIVSAPPRDAADEAASKFVCFGEHDWRPPESRQLQVPLLGEPAETRVTLAASAPAHIYQLLPTINLAPPIGPDVARAGKLGGPWGIVSTIVEGDTGRVRRIPLLQPSARRAAPDDFLAHLVLMTWLSGHEEIRGTSVSQERIRACLSQMSEPPGDALCDVLQTRLQDVGGFAPPLRYRLPENAITVVSASFVAGLPDYPAYSGDASTLAEPDFLILGQSGQSDPWAPFRPNCGPSFETFARNSCDALFKGKYVIIGSGRQADGDFITTPLTPPLSLDLLTKPIGGGAKVRSELPGAIVLGLFLAGLAGGEGEFINIKLWVSVLAIGAALGLGLLLGSRVRRLDPKTDGFKLFFLQTLGFVLILLGICLQALLFWHGGLSFSLSQATAAGVVAYSLCTIRFSDGSP